MNRNQLAFEEIEPSPKQQIDIDLIVSHIGAAARSHPYIDKKPTSTENYWEELGGREDPKAVAEFYIKLSREKLAATDTNHAAL